MKIGIDASRAFLTERTGTEEYSYELIKNLIKISDPETNFILYAKRGANINFDLPQNFSVQKIGGNFLWTQLHLSLEMMKNEIDVLFVPSHTIPLIHPRKTATTLHGLEFKTVSNCYPLEEKILLEMHTFLNIIFSKKIIVPSENTGLDLIKYYKVDPRKIKVINHAVEKQENVQRKNNKSELNILFIGRLEKRKNILGIIRAFDKFMEKAEKMPDPDRKINLILAGKRRFGFKEIEKEISLSAHKDSIFLPGYVSEEEKKKLYSAADVFIFPSFYEGFGIPVLEAMSFGVPVICSNNSSLKEVAGDAAITADPSDTEKISSALLELFQNYELRQKMIEAGRKNMERFDWEKCAKETLGVLKNI